MSTPENPRISEILILLRHAKEKAETIQREDGWLSRYEIGNIDTLLSHLCNAVEEAEHIEGNISARNRAGEEGR